MICDTLLLCLAQDCLILQLRTGAADHPIRVPTICDDLIKIPNDTVAKQRRLGDEAYTLPHADFGNSQTAEPRHAGSKAGNVATWPSVTNLFIQNEHL